MEIPSGTEIQEEKINCLSTVPFGHKIAIQNIKQGEPIRKYGQVIGFAAKTIKPGEHVHTHNINVKDFSRDYAIGVDAKPSLKKPDNKSMIEFLAEVQEIDMEYKPKNQIIINERTGTIIAGVGIEVKPIMLTHGDITIKISEQEEPAKPEGSIVVDDSLVIGLNENELYTKNGTTTVANLVRSLQKMGATPKDIISILETMKSAGSISAELKVI